MVRTRNLKPAEIAVIIPAYDEAGRIGSVVKAVAKKRYRVIVVDDGCKDKTADEAHSAGATVLTHIINLGKGAAMRTGTEYALQEGAQAIIFMDGDGQHDPTELVKFAEKLNRNEIVFGARRKKLPFPRSLGKSIISKTFKILYDIKIDDPLNGYRGFRTEIYPALEWRSDDYAVESEIIANAGRAHLKSTEVPVKTIYHDKYKGVTPLDGFPIIWNLIMWRLQRHKTRDDK
jgi:glycosyltransferase involved in cell wall biosynthesis